MVSYILFSYRGDGERFDSGVGIKSVARQKLSGLADLATISTGLAVFRATLEVSTVSSDPDLAHLVQEPGINIW